jgi:hypothetical protein
MCTCSKYHQTKIYSGSNHEAKSSGTNHHQTKSIAAAVIMKQNRIAVAVTGK